MSETAQVDGRRQRADESRRRIALAMLDIARAGEPAPSAEQVAEAAGVGRRTVFRLFNDMEGVYREMHAVMVDRVGPMFAEPFEATTWRGRVDELIERRAGMFEEMRPIKTAADVHKHRSAFLREGHANITRLQRKTLMAQLPERVRADGELLDALDLCFSFEAWRRLRQEQRLPVKQAIAVWKRLARKLLD